MVHCCEHQASFVHHILLALQQNDCQCDCVFPFCPTSCDEYDMGRQIETTVKLVKARRRTKTKFCVSKQIFLFIAKLKQNRTISSPISERIYLERLYVPLNPERTLNPSRGNISNYLSPTESYCKTYQITQIILSECVEPDLKAKWPSGWCVSTTVQVHCCFIKKKKKKKKKTPVASVLNTRKTSVVQ